MFSKVERLRAKYIRMSDLYARKNNDYGDSFGETFRKLGIISAATRITDKYNRFISLAIGKEQMVDDESMEDTLIDLACYSIMTIIELEDLRERNKQAVKAAELVKSALEEDDVKKENEDENP